MVQLSNLELKDSLLDAGALTEEYEVVFRTEDMPLRIMPYKNKFKTAVTFELSHSQRIYYRRVYSILDWLRDIGGLYGALWAIFGGFVIVF